MIVISPAGRPHKENPRNVNLNIRITKDEANRIQKCADEQKRVVKHYLAVIDYSDTNPKGIDKFIISVSFGEIKHFLKER